MNSDRHSMQGKVCLVTGSSSGIGYVTAHALAQRGATTVLVARNASKGSAAVARIKSSTGNPNVTFLQADLSSQQEVRALVQQFKQQYAALHVLINNAGTLLVKREESADGIEMTFALNHLSPFLLTNLLLDTLKKSAPARIITISSELHARARLEFDDVQGRRRYSGMAVYNRSKLTNVLFTYALARRLQGTGVTANVVGLGLTRTGLYRSQNVGLLLSLACRLLTLMAPAAERAAETILDLATSPDLACVTGRYFANRKDVPSSKTSYDQASTEKLWQLSEKLTGLAV